VKKHLNTLVMPAMLAVCIAQQSWAAPPPTGGSMSGSVVEYNAAQLKNNSDMLTVPPNMVTYTANTTIAAGAIVMVHLPVHFQFTTQQVPSLSSAGSTFELVHMAGNSASFVVVTSAIVAGSTIQLGGYTVSGAARLESIVPVASALPVTFQVIGVDPQPLPFPEFASDTGVHAIFVGAIQFIDLGSPSRGSRFGTGRSEDTRTDVISAIAISPEIVDFTNMSTPVLTPTGQPNTLDSYESATVLIPGISFANITAFSALDSSCKQMVAPGNVTPTALVFPSIPLNREIFFCVSATGNNLITMNMYPSGFNTIQVLPGHPYDDFLASTNVEIEFPGFFCYSYGTVGGCMNEYFNLLEPFGQLPI